MQKKYLKIKCVGVLLVMMITHCSYAQKTAQTNSFDEEYDLAIDLYEKGMYGVAGDKFEKLYNRTQDYNYHVDRTDDIEFYMLVSRMKYSTKAGIAELKNYVEKNSTSINGNTARFVLGEYYLDNEQYSEACEYLSSVNPALLDKSEYDKYEYELAYSYFNNEQYEKAGDIFVRLKDRPTIYQNPASYYWGYINYYNGKYDTALKEFEKLEGQSGFDKVIPYYIAQIYFKQEKYKEAISMAQNLQSTADALQQQELYRILGVSYFKTGNYSEALNNLNLFENSGGVMSEGESYAKAYCLYNDGDYSSAIPYFKGATNLNNEIAQNAYYHLASSYLKTSNKEGALMAFGEAAKLKHDSKIREEALFNVAKLSWDTDYSPFNENLKAIQSYLSDYPNGVHSDEAYEYLTQAFMSANDYDQALNAINNITAKSDNAKKIAQQIYYNKGVDLFNSHKYAEAVENFNEAILQGSFDSPYRALSRYWKSEAYYQMRDFREAYRAIQQFYNTKGAKESGVYDLSFYTKGYLAFNIEEYSNAIDAFSKYINSGYADDVKECDSYNRIGDAYYQMKYYKEALSNFKESLREGKHEDDYANYMMAMCYGRLGNDRAKQKELSKFRDDYPKSAYVDDALYELGLSFERQKNYAGAEAYFNIILNYYAESEYYRKILLKYGLYYFRDGDYSLAAKYYERTVREFPNSEEAKEAMAGLKRAYTYNKEVDKYVAFSESVYGTRVSASEQDSLNFRSAERMFMQQDKGAQQALENYMSKFPNGAFSLDANYYMGELLYGKKDYAAAYENYKVVTAFSANEYTESALLKCAELCYSAGDYNAAEGYYDQVLLVPSTKWVKLTAQMGVMNVYYKLGKYDKAIDVSKRALNSDVIGQKQKEEIESVLGICYYKKGDYDKALDVFETLAEKPQTEIGARAKYSIAEIKYNNGDYTGAEKDLLEFVSSGTSQQFWLGKSFILLSNVYTQKGDRFQAKHTLQSLVDNYSVEDDGILDKAKEKLQEIKASAEVDESKPQPMEINVSE
ncbi:MAG: tetratricopeptide repeat protein [Bacteroidales bacterium]